MSGEGSSKQQGITKDQCREIFWDAMEESGTREILKRWVQSQLAQSGWTLGLKTACIRYIQDKGAENVNIAHV